MTSKTRSVPGSNGRRRLLEVVPMEHGDGVALRVEGESGPNVLLTDAAVEYFEFPTGDRKSGYYIGASKITDQQLVECMQKKRLCAYRDGASRLWRVFYKEICIRFHEHTTRAERQAALAEHEVEITDVSVHRAGVVYVRSAKGKPSRTKFLRILKALGRDPRIALAIPNYISEVRRCSALPSPTLPEMHRHLELIGAADAWKLATGAGVTIAILDDGLDMAHPAFDSRIALATQFNFSPRRTGDDLRDARPRVVRQKGAPDQPEPNDYHGTACAGVAAAGRNGTVRGVAPDATILPIKIFRGLTMAPESALADAITYAEEMGAKVISCSWFYARGPRDKRSEVDDAIERVAKRGAIVVCAAGDNVQNWVNEPAAQAMCIAVGASTRQLEVTPDSNFGSKICVYAPSRDTPATEDGILTTDCIGDLVGYNPGIPGSADPEGLTYGGFGGTSAATAIVSGTVALMLQANPGLTWSDVHRILRETGEPLTKRQGDLSAIDRRAVHAGRAVAGAKALLTHPPA